MVENYKFSKLKLIKDKKPHEKVVEKIFKFIGYTIGHISLLPHLTLKGLSSSKKSFRKQTTTYEENGVKVYRRLEAKDGLLTEFKGLNTCFDIFLSSVNICGNSPCMGERKIIEEIETKNPEAGKPNLQYLLSDFEWMTYNEVLEEVNAVSSVLENFNLKNGGKVLFFADTCKQWMILALSVMKIKGIIVTAYSTLSDENLEYILNLTQPSVVFVDCKSFTRIFPILDILKSLTHVILNKNSKAYPLNQNVKNKKFTLLEYENLNKYTRNDIDKENIENFPNIKNLDNINYSEREKDDIPKDSDVVLIMFTSGSLGVPKGVLINNKNIVSIMGGVCHRKEFWSKKTYPAYLQLSHILEFCAELAVFSFGGRVGYCRPITLISNFPGLIPGCKGDLDLLKPSTIFTVPLILERIKKAVLDKIKNQKRGLVLLFELAYNMRSFYYSRGYETPVLNKLFFKRLRKIMGGNLEYGMIGGSIIFPETEEFINICFGTFKQAYGTTELCCGATFSEIDYFRPGNTGPPIGCAEIKLQSWEEAGYFADNRTNPCGEILVHGANVSVGYYKNDKENEESFFIDNLTGKRWFKTGDIGEFLPDGTLRIIDRKKDIIKLNHGEFVCLSLMENILCTSIYVENCCVLPDISYSKLVGLVVVDRKTVSALAEDFGIDPKNNFEGIFGDRDIIDIISSDLNEKIEMAKLQKWMALSKIIYVRELWTPESGLVTPTMKIKRMAIRKKYENFIE